MKAPGWFVGFINFYRDGFKGMTVGKTLWVIALIKLFIMFAVLKMFFFPNYLNSKFEKERDKANYVGTELYKKSKASSESTENNFRQQDKNH